MKELFATRKDATARDALRQAMEQNPAAARAYCRQ
jgi:hypothetical protein